MCFTFVAEKSHADDLSNIQYEIVQTEYLNVTHKHAINYTFQESFVNDLENIVFFRKLFFFI